jgi:hypothetical protein
LRGFTARNVPDWRRDAAFMGIIIIPGTGSIQPLVGKDTRG